VLDSVVFVKTRSLCGGLHQFLPKYPLIKGFGSKQILPNLEKQDRHWAKALSATFVKAGLGFFLIIDVSWLLI